MAEASGTAQYIEVRNLTKAFDELVVLNDISFNIDRGELVSIVGPTGCGKTTFMNTLSKLIPATAGDIWINGEPADPRTHNIAYVFQEPTSLPWRKVRDNVAYGMEVKHVPQKEKNERLDRILDLVGLADCADLYPNQISASMEQRIAVARAFATDPDLLLMDEPYGQLDIKLRYYLEDELIRLWQKLKATVIFVTHNIEEAVYLAERILVLSNKPTTIKGDIRVDLPRPRDYLDPDFIRIRKEVTDMIRWW
ncbi:nitrate ABC transporter ATP-binding protein [Desulfosarcina alkanivorans]|uniref:Nitrate ABC transporter ATP-binding protein n=1 Tax=Desulfosarcina alkanivorans TaxID=571177 RepID=A0A5K7YH55_9BACT|nr:ABC transporter ATP-binding protein [Desulfosarcina alkanivorans]BBO67893.1 nitrate ABC transporter ATP-binding protein [Desulfosarcina alkanivorans]